MDALQNIAQMREILAKTEEISDPVRVLLSAAFDLSSALLGRVEALETQVKLLTEQLDEVEDALDEMVEDVYGENEVFEVKCPSCKGVIQVDRGILQDGTLVCPSCDETLEFDIGHCDCGHHGESDLKEE